MQRFVTVSHETEVIALVALVGLTGGSLVHVAPSYVAAIVVFESKPPGSDDPTERHCPSGLPHDAPAKPPFRPLGLTVVQLEPFHCWANGVVELSMVSVVP
jgi:hypothetical protein